jgi:hypothetical protein
MKPIDHLTRLFSSEEFRDILTQQDCNIKHDTVVSDEPMNPKNYFAQLQSKVYSLKAVCDEE